MKLFPALAVFLLLALAGCVGTPTEALTLEAIAPTTQTPDQPGARKDGAYPDINRLPQGETQQLTASDTARIKRELEPASQRSLAANPQAAAKAHDADVSEMQKLLDYHAKRKAEPSYD